MPLVSVIMPVYNTKIKYLKEAIESILNQTYRDFEFIIYDDGSKEDYSIFFNLYNDERIHYYKNEHNLGAAAARNALINLAKGKYIAFQDSDDISLPTRLEKQVQFLETHANISGVSSWVETFPNSKILKNVEEPKILDFLAGCSFIQGVVMLRLEDLKKNDLFYNPDYKTSEDYDLWCRVIKHVRLFNLQEVLLKYRRNGESLVHTKGKEKTIIDKKIKQEILNYLTSTQSLQWKIAETVSDYYKKKNSFVENIFSIKNEWLGLTKFKTITFLGLKYRLKNYE